ncbi:MAG: PAS domain S-box protein, partial [Rhodoferax sp.]|nr:PAS domain S-box protein [Rhodoferax sp.]
MKPVRLLAEILLIFAVAEISISMVLPLLIPDASPLTEGFLDIAMLVCLCAPVIYWRFNQVFGGLDKDLARSRVGLSQPGRAVALTALAQVAGLLLTAGGVWWQSNRLDEHAQYQFHRAAERTKNEVLTRLNQSVYGLRGAKGAMAASPNFRRREFRAYVASRNMAAEFPGIRGFGFIERVQRTDLQAFVARERADGAPAFAVRTSGSAPELLVIKYLEPLAANLAALGFDVAQEPVRKLAAERAIDTGEPALTGLIELVQDENKTPGFLYFVPVYKSGAAPQSPLERQRDLVGLLYAPIVAVELFDKATVVSDHMVDFELYEGSVIRPWKLIHRSDGAEAAPKKMREAQPLPKTKYSVDDVVYVGSQALTLRAYASPRFTAAQDRSSLVFVGVGGVLLSLLVAMTVWLLAVSRQRAQALASAMTSELERMAQVVKHTGSAVAIMDCQMRIEWVNAGFTLITGYALDETLGKTPAELLSSHKSDPVAIEALRESVKNAVACRVELINRAKDGSNYWVDVELQPTFDAQKNLVGFMEISTDITQSKQTQHQLETALRETDAILTTVRTHAIVSETSRDDVILSVNDAFCQISGYSREELIGHNHNIINSGVHTPAFWTDFWQTIGSGQPWRGEVCNRAKDGTLYWVDSMIAPFVGADGEIEKYVSIRTDITARRRAADQLIQSEATFSAMFSQSSTAMALLSMTGRTMKINTALCDLLGYTQDDLLELSLADVSHPDEWNVDRLQEAGLLAGEVERYQRVKRYVHRDGHIVWGLASVSVVRAADESVSFIIVQIVDITARKRAEEALNVSNALMEESQAIAKVGGWELDVKSGALYWTHETYRIHETTPDDFNPTVDAGVGYFPPDSRERITQAMQAALERGESYDLELQTHTTQGHLIDVRTTGTATVEDGKTVRVSGIFQDITQRKQYERSLLEARAAAELATQSKGQFLANMSHEIRTPMNAILGMLKLLGNTALSSNQHDYVRKTEGAARSLLGLINDILDFSKIDAGRMELDLSPFRVDRLMRDLAVVLTANVGAKPIEVLYDLDPTLPASVLGDAMRLQQVLINLAGNAVKFTSAGQVVVSLQRVSVDPQKPAAHGPSEVTGAANEPDVALIRFAVKDSGIGIAPENQAKIFSGFSQAEASTSRRFGGTGLGLAISQRLVQVMGGQIEIESQLGVGSTFSFTLRLPRAAQDDSLAPEPVAVLPAQRVLVI